MSRADLHGVLRGSNLAGANLVEANLKGADLSDTNLAAAQTATVPPGIPSQPDPDGSNRENTQAAGPPKTPAQASVQLMTLANLTKPYGPV